MFFKSKLLYGEKPNQVVFHKDEDNDPLGEINNAPNHPITINDRPCGINASSDEKNLQSSVNLKENSIIEIKNNNSAPRKEAKYLNPKAVAVPTLPDVINKVRTKRNTNSPKGLTPCPFLSRRGWCAKGNRCDFQHPTRFHDEYKHITPCPFLQRRGHCLKGNMCDFSHDSLYHEVNRLNPDYHASFLSQHRPYPRMRIRTKRQSPNHWYKTQLRQENNVPEYYPTPQSLRFPPPLMSLPLRPPLINHASIPAQYMI